VAISTAELTFDMKVREEGEVAVGGGDEGIIVRFDERVARSESDGGEARDYEIEAGSRQGLAGVGERSDSRTHVIASNTTVTAAPIESTFHLLLKKLDEREVTLLVSSLADCLLASPLAWYILVGSPGVQSSLANMGCSTRSSLL